MVAYPAVVFRLLCCEVRVEYQDARIAESLRYMIPPADQPGRITCTFKYAVCGQGPYEVYEQGDLLEQLNSPEDVLYRIYSRAYTRLLDRFVVAGWLLLHAGLARVGGQRFLLLGDKGAGKTTLMTRLVFDGHGFEGDEMVLARPGEAISAPRCLHLKPGIEKNIPELQGRLDELPMVHAGESIIRALDPTRFGFNWAIELGTIDHVITLQPNHGGKTDLSPLSSFQTLQEIANGFMGWGESSRLLASTAAKLSKKGGYRLRLGDPARAVQALKTLTER